MDRELMKSIYCETIVHQLKDNEPICTKLVYDKLIEHGYDENRAVDLLGYYLGEYMLDMLKDEKDYDENTWQEMILNIDIDDRNNAVKVSSYDMKKIASRIKKEFGSIPHGNEDYYLEGLAVYENNILVVADRNGLNSRQIRTIVELWMYNLYGSLNKVNYDFSDVAEEAFIEIAKVLDYNSDPYKNEELIQNLVEEHPEVDFSLYENQLRIFKMAFLLLGRIHDSIDFWEKEFGSNGYLTYLRNIGIA